MTIEQFNNKVKQSIKNNGFYSTRYKGHAITITEGGGYLPDDKYEGYIDCDGSSVSDSKPYLVYQELMCDIDNL